MNLFVKIFYCTLFSLISTVGFSQKISLNPERKVSKKTEKIIAAISEKVLEITKDATNDAERVEHIYGWIQKNISFDTLLFAYIENIGYKAMPGKKGLKSYFKYHKLAWQVRGKGKLQEMQTAEQTFKRGKGVSGGIAELFNSMCEFANIESYVVIGYGKGNNWQVKDQFHHANHAWNAVKVIDTWHLIDPTWDWYNATPEEFVLRHAPCDPAWQMLKRGVSIELFEKDSLSILKYLNGTELAGIKPLKQNFNDSIEALKKMTDVQRLKCIADRTIRYNNKNYFDPCIDYYVYGSCLLQDSLSELGNHQHRINLIKYCAKTFDKSLELAKKASQNSTQKLNKRELEKIQAWKKQALADADEAKKTIDDENKDRETDGNEMLKEVKTEITDKIKGIDEDYKKEMARLKANKDSYGMADLKKKYASEISVEKKRNQIRLNLTQENNQELKSSLKEIGNQHGKYAEKRKAKIKEIEKLKIALESRRYKADKDAHKQVQILCEKQSKYLKDYLKKQKPEKKIKIA